MAVLEEKVSLQSPYLPQDLLSTHFLMNLRERYPLAKYKIDVAILMANVKRKLAHPCIYQHWLVRLLLSWFVVDKKPKLLEYIDTERSGGLNITKCETGEGLEGLELKHRSS